LSTGVFRIIANNTRWNVLPALARIYEQAVVQQQVNQGREVPMTVLETPRLRLRPLTLDDLEPLHVLLNHPDVWQFDPGFARSLEVRKEWLTYRIYELKMQGVGALAVVRQTDQQLIGQCGLEVYLEELMQHEASPFSTWEVELFYHFGRAYWGQGYAVEAAHAVIAHAFRTLKLKRIVTRGVHRENLRSIRVLERVGMRIFPDTYAQEEMMGILENPWREALPP
jgi:ribosomal-protein-alanine N-acetyltransferase